MPPAGVGSPAFSFRVAVYGRHIGDRLVLNYVSTSLPSMFDVVVLVPVESVLLMVLAMVKGSR